MYASPDRTSQCTLAMFVTKRMCSLQALHRLGIHQAAEVVKICADDMLQAYQTFRSIAIDSGKKHSEQFERAAQLLSRFSIGEAMHCLSSGTYQIFEGLLNVVASP